MKIIKLIKTIMIIPKSLKYLRRIEVLVDEKDYDKAYIYLEKMNQLYRHNHKYIDYYMLKYYLDFLTKKHTNVLDLLEKIDNLIKQDIDDYENAYRRKFIYSLAYIVYILNDNKKSADDTLLKINKLYFNVSNIRPRLRRRYPLYTAKSLEKTFQENHYDDLVPKEKLNNIIDCFPKSVNNEIKNYKVV